MGSSGDPQHRRYPAQPRGRELRRCDPRGQRAGAPVGRNRPAYEFAQSLGFPQINIDLIAGMLGETDDNWRRACADDRDGARQRHDLSDGAAIQHDDQPEPADRCDAVPSQVAGWSAKRRWVRKRSRRWKAPATHRIGLHGREEPGDEVRVPRPALAGCRHGRPGRRLVRPHQRRAHAEPRHVRGILRAASKPGRIPLARALRPTPKSG